MDDPGHLGDPETDGASRARRSARVCAVLALVLAVVAIGLAAVPFASFFAGLPALAAIVVAVVAVVLGARRVLPAIGAALAVLALAVAVGVSAQRTVADLGAVTADPARPIPAGSGASADGRGATAALAAGTHSVVYEVLGAGTSDVTYTAFVGERSGGSAEDAVSAPHRRSQRVTVTEQGTARFSMVAVATESGERLGCRISIDGRPVAERPAATGRAAACIAAAG